MTEPSPGEMMRQIDGIVRRLDTLASQLETGYVRKDSHEQALKAIEAMHLSGIRLIETRMESDRNTAERATAEVAQDVKDAREASERGIAALKADRERDTAWKRQITATLIASLIGVTGTAGIAVFNLLVGG